ncbi:hypothetical protein, partial [Mycolicibacterium llatzerense]|uniref:hypothetical protein n=1 Tax=Mycolicibacterium llatzerense TaxID=280871 RepID=UPI0008DDDE89
MAPEVKVAESFANTPEFGRFVSEIRSRLGGSRRSVEERGGPSERHQQDIESGKEMPITARIRVQYGQYLEGVEAESRSFFDAACAVFSGAQHTPEPTGVDEFWPLYAGGGFTVGDLDRPGATITVGSLIPGGVTGLGPVGVIARDCMRRGGADGEFVRVASRIATRHAGITVMPWPTAVANRFTSGDGWPGHCISRIGVAESTGFPRLFMDPLREVNDLEKAYLRAAALGAADNDRACLAWAVLLANGVAAKTGTHPLQSWISLFAPLASAKQSARDEWSNLIVQLASQTEVTTTVTVGEVIKTAQPYLLQWAEDWLAAKGLKFNAFEESGGTQLMWSLGAAGADRFEWSPADGEDV